MYGKAVVAGWVAAVIEAGRAALRPLFLIQAMGDVRRKGHGVGQEITPRAPAGQAEDDQGSAGREEPTEAHEGVAERQMVDGGDTGDDVVRAIRYPVQRISDSEGHRIRGCRELPSTSDDRGVDVDPVHCSGP